MPAPPPQNLPLDENNPDRSSDPQGSPSLSGGGLNPEDKHLGFAGNPSISDVFGNQSSVSMEDRKDSQDSGLSSLTPAEGSDQKNPMSPQEAQQEEQSLKVMPPEYRDVRGSRDWKQAMPLQPLSSAPPPPPAEKKEKKPFLSKKILFFLIAIIIIGGGLFVYFNWFASSEYDISPEEPLDIPFELPEEEETAPSPLETPNGTPETPGDLPEQDSDGDGLSDQEEENLGTNLQDADSDQDGMPDGWEVENNLDPLDSSDSTQDPDGDDLDNANEYYYNSDPHNEDTDGDSYPDGSEVQNGYDPAKAGAKLTSPPKKEEGVTSTPEERDKTRRNDLKALELALELYYDDNGFFPMDLGSLTPDYVVRVPQDPLGSRSAYQYERFSPSSYELRAVAETGGEETEGGMFRVRVTQ